MDYNEIFKMRRGKREYKGCELSSPIYQQIVKEKKKFERKNPGKKWEPKLNGIGYQNRGLVDAEH